MRISVLLLAVMAVASVASADVVLFNDSMQNGWNISQWDAYYASDLVHSGSKSLAGGGGWTMSGPGIAMGTNTKVEVYLDTVNTNQVIFGIEATIDGQLYQFVNRQVMNSYDVDGVTVNPATYPDLGWAEGITLNTTPGWQKVTLDLTQPSYYWNGQNTMHPIPTASSIITGIALKGGSGLRLDDIRLVPEPATMSILGLGLMGLIRRRRA